MRLSGKTVIERQLGNDLYISSDFDKREFDGSIRDKGYDVIHEKAYLCPCKSRESSHRNTCKNCGGVGWIFANPTKTKMLISGIMQDNKLKDGGLREWGMMDTGTVKITALNEDKLTFMDRIVVLDATGEHNQILYPQKTDDDTTLFSFTKYDIKSIDFIGLFDGENNRIKRLVETTDYLYHDNVITFDSQYNALLDPCVTIRYIHNPVVHVIDVLRESATSTKDQGVTKLILPILALGRKAHLIKDVENFDGDRLIDNSWKPTACESEDLTVFQRQLRYTSSQTLFDNLTAKQKSELIIIMQALSGISGSHTNLTGVL